MGIVPPAIRRGQAPRTGTTGSPRSIGSPDGAAANARTVIEDSPHERTSRSFSDVRRGAPLPAPVLTQRRLAPSVARRKRDLALLAPAVHMVVLRRLLDKTRPSPRPTAVMTAGVNTSAWSASWRRHFGVRLPTSDFELLTSNFRLRQAPGVGIEPTRSFWDLRISSRAEGNRVMGAEGTVVPQSLAESFQRHATTSSEFRRAVSPTLAGTRHPPPRRGPRNPRAGCRATLWAC